MRNLFIVISFLFLIAAIPLGVFLVREQSTLGAKADAPTVSKIEFVGSNVKDFRAESPDIKVQISYIQSKQAKSAPTSIRLANDASSLDSATVVPFTSNRQIIEWKLSAGNGQKVVYLQFNIDGSWVPPISNSIILEGQPDQSPGATGVSSSTPPPSALPSIAKSAFDLNGDGQLNDKDLLIIQQKIENKSSQTNDPADFNKDGVVNNEDYTLLLRRIQSKN